MQFDIWNCLELKNFWWIADLSYQLKNRLLTLKVFLKLLLKKGSDNFKISKEVTGFNLDDVCCWFGIDITYWGNHPLQFLSFSWLYINCSFLKSVLDHHLVNSVFASLLAHLDPVYQQLKLVVHWIQRLPTQLVGCSRSSPVFASKQTIRLKIQILICLLEKI